ncbi:hypothetical protein B5V02_20365 [Mesorhizobium kowhaii]|uniref:Uncharacterized protein n=1 Tax=Mesorhizobium kowhaii TaxID=1300272 RepID=A0A2W7C4H0_9HYPH|nr:hypothetical protein B5V02_20365 [Mesorhizobium kowhaii]
MLSQEGGNSFKTLLEVLVISIGAAKCQPYCMGFDCSSDDEWIGGADEEPQRSRMIHKMARSPVFRQSQPSMHGVWLRFIAKCPEYVVQDLISCLKFLSLPFDQPINRPVLQPASSNVSCPDVCTPSGGSNA